MPSTNNNNTLISRLIKQGENGGIEFKTENVRPEGLAREITAFSNTNGGTILIGIDDDGNITGISKHDNIEEWVANIVRNNVIPATSPEINLLSYKEQQVLKVDVPRGLNKPYQTIDGKYWLRVGSTNRMATKEELSRLFQQAGLVHFDISQVTNSSIKDLDPDALYEYWYTYYDIDYFELEPKEQQQLLLNADILTELSGEINATIGGLLIFGNSPQRRIPQATIIFAVFDGNVLTDDLLDKQEIVGTLPQLIIKTGAKIRTFLPRPSTIAGMKRQEKPLISDNVIRETIVNAVCHRDYSIYNRKTTVYIFKNRIEITSPGRLPNTLSIEKILTGNSAPRNHFILKYLDNMRFSDGLGRGVPMIKKEMGNRFSYSEEGELLKLTLNFNEYLEQKNQTQAYIKI